MTKHLALAEEAPFVTESKNSWWIFCAESTAFDAAMIKFDVQVYIDKPPSADTLRATALPPEMAGFFFV